MPTPSPDLLATLKELHRDKLTLRERHVAVARHVDHYDFARGAEALVAKWRPRVDGMANIRHAKMVTVILGETLEHQRFFAQIGQGNELVFGRRMPGAGTGNGVMGVRWVE